MFSKKKKKIPVEQIGIYVLLVTVKEIKCEWYRSNLSGILAVPWGTED